MTDIDDVSNQLNMIIRLFEMILELMLKQAGAYHD
jgi:hypothetical protein